MGAEQQEFIDWEVTLGKNLEELLTNGTTGANNSYFH